MVSFTVSFIGLLYPCLQYVSVIGFFHTCLLPSVQAICERDLKSGGQQRLIAETVFFHTCLLPYVSAMSRCCPPLLRSLSQIASTDFFPSLFYSLFYRLYPCRLHRICIYIYIYRNTYIYIYINIYLNICGHVTLESQTRYCCDNHHSSEAHSLNPKS